ncbi:MAG: anti-sigma factor [Solirubrobacteraceae bacterium]
MSASDEDRIAYLAGEPVESLTSDERAELDQLRALLEADEMWADPPAELEDRVVAAIADAAGTAEAPESTRAPLPRQFATPVQPAEVRRAAREAEARQPRQAPSTRPAPSPQAARVVKKPRRERSWVMTILERPAYAFGVLAVLVALVAGITALSRSGGGTRSPAPLQFAMVVNGTPLAPGAHGSATLTKMSSGWQVELSASGLPHLTNGRYYQAWLKNSAGVLVPIGTFNDAVKVTLWSGVPVTQFRTLTVTRQEANGNPASSGQRVLIGTIKSSG